MEEQSTFNFDDFEDDELKNLLSNVLIVYNIPKEIDHQTLYSDFEYYNNVIKEFKYIRPLRVAVVIFEAMDDAVECKLVLGSKYDIGFGEVREISVSP